MKTQATPTRFQQMVKSGEVTRATKSGGFVGAEVCARIKVENKARVGWKIWAD